MNKKLTSIRQRGRPVAVANNDMRERLLDAATELFAEQGIAATPMSAIAARVGVTTAMLHYYFKMREQLLDVVVDERLGRFITLVTEVIDGAQDDPVSMVHDLVTRIVSLTDEMPWLPALWIKEIASDGGQLRERMFQRFPLDVQKRFGACVAAGQTRGDVNPELHPYLLFVSVMGLTMFPLAVAKIWERFPALKALGRQGVADHAAALLLYGLAGRKHGHVKGRTGAAAKH